VHAAEQGVQSGAARLPQSHRCPGSRQGTVCFGPVAGSRESTRQKKQASKCVCMVLGSLRRRNRQGETHPFRDETRKIKRLRKGSAKVAFPAIPPQREQELAVASRAALLGPGLCCCGWQRVAGTSAGPKCHCHHFSILGCQMKKQGRKPGSLGGEGCIGSLQSLSIM